MSYTRNFVPKKRKKTNYFLVVSFLILILIFGLLSLKYLTQKPESEKDNFSICSSYDAEKSRSILKSQKYSKTKSISEIGFYGEVLGLYETPYALQDFDWMNGKTVFVKNLCNNAPEQAFILNKELDLKFPVIELEPGFYTVEVLNGLERQRIISDQVLDQSIVGITRDSKRKSIHVFADKDQINSDDVFVDDENLLYIQIQYVDVDEEVVDVVLDPTGLTYHANGAINYGAQANGLVESDEMYDVALGVQSILKEHGVNAVISRDNKNPLNYYGGEGRAKKAYENEAKYFFQLRFLYGWSQHDKGATMIYPSLTSNRFAYQLMKEIQDATDLESSQWKSGSNRFGVYQSLDHEGLDRTDIFRELSGKFMGAGLDSDFEMEDFKDNSIGVHATIIEYGYVTDVNAVATWKSQKQEIIEATARGILNSLGVRP